MTPISRWEEVWELATVSRASERGVPATGRKIDMVVCRNCGVSVDASDVGTHSCASGAETPGTPVDVATLAETPSASATVLKGAGGLLLMVAAALWGFASLTHGYGAIGLLPRIVIAVVLFAWGWKLVDFAGMQSRIAKSRLAKSRLGPWILPDWLRLDVDAIPTYECPNCSRRTSADFKGRCFYCDADLPADALIESGTAPHRTVESAPPAPANGEQPSHAANLNVDATIVETSASTSDRGDASHPAGRMESEEDGCPHCGSSHDTAEEALACAEQSSNDENPAAVAPMHCGHRMIPIVYGLPSPDMGESAGRGEIAIGGCFVGDDSPAWKCTVCGREEVSGDGGLHMGGLGSINLGR